jgi:predicted N-formylglutamate amidohydrolase
MSAEHLASHIAWDIGAAAVTEIISDHLRTPAILCGVSRLVIDCNRQLNSPELIPASSGGTTIPGNVVIDKTSREMRIERWFHPYHDAVETLLRERIRQRSMPVVVAVHSMTPVLYGRSRPWPVALSSDTDRRLSNLILAALCKPGDILVGDNEPYCVDPLVDYSIPFHALRRGLFNAQVEFRQDEIDTSAGQQYWAMRLAHILQALQLV